MKEIHVKFIIFPRQTGSIRIFRSVGYDTMHARGVYKLSERSLFCTVPNAQSPKPVDLVEALNGIRTMTSRERNATVTFVAVVLRSACLSNGTVLFEYTAAIKR